MWKRKPQTAVCPTCRVVHQPVEHGEFREYCQADRRPMLEADERRYNVQDWFNHNYDRLAKQYDEEMAAQCAKQATNNQANYANRASAKANVGLDAYGLGGAANIFGVPDA